jgi:hypothetical protein
MFQINVGRPSSTAESAFIERSQPDGCHHRTAVDPPVPPLERPQIKDILTFCIPTQPVLVGQSTSTRVAQGPYPVVALRLLRKTLPLGGGPVLQIQL